MYSSPSPLLGQLLQARLCTHRDLRRCRPLVRRLTHDLPIFDSVWLDALVQIGRLTPWQARTIDQHGVDALLFGPCIATAEIAREPNSRVLLAHHHESTSLWEIRAFAPLSNATQPTLESLKLLAATCRNHSHPCLGLPIAAELWHDQSLFISAAPPGRTLHDLLIHEGRFTQSATLAIARDLLSGLDFLEQRGLVHGDLRMSTVRYSSQPAAATSSIGWLPIVFPSLSIHTPLPLDSLDVLAPELTAGAKHSISTDLYALGCILWQLLAGRPVFATNDPLAKWSSHAHRPVPNIRDWHFDVSPQLADFISLLTHPDPAHRPKSPRELLRQLPTKIRHLRSSSGNASTPLNLRPWHGEALQKPPFPWLAGTLATSIVIATALALFQGGPFKRATATTTPEQLQQPSHLDSSEKTPPTTPSPSLAPRRLPIPDSAGRIILSEPGLYEPRPLQSSGKLTIRAARGVSARILIAGQPWKLSCAELLLDGLSIESQNPDISSLLDVTAHSLTIRDSNLSAQTTPPAPSAAAISWRSPRSSPSHTPILTIENLTLFHVGIGLRLQQLPPKIDVTNLLKIGPAPLFVASRGGNSRLNLAQVTLRQSGPLLLTNSGTQKFSLSAQDCIWDILPDSSLIEFQNVSPPDGWHANWQIAGSSNLIPPSLSLFGTRLPTGDLQPLEDPSVPVDGLITDEFTFLGPPDNNPQNSTLATSQAPRSTNLGFQPSLQPSP